MPKTKKFSINFNTFDGLFLVAIAINWKVMVSLFIALIIVYFVGLLIEKL